MPRALEQLPKLKTDTIAPRRPRRGKSQANTSREIRSCRVVQVRDTVSLRTLPVCHYTACTSRNLPIRARVEEH